MTNEEKQNLQFLFNSTHEKIISIYTITNYFTEIAKDLFSKNENKLELISLDLLKSYFHLPYYLTKLLYSNIFKANENELINLKSFIDGMINLYFIPIQEKIKIYFDFFDVLNIGKVYTNDIVLILKHFHLLTKNNKNEIFNQFIKYSFQFNLNQELTFENWEQLIKENSDVFILIIYFFDYFKPFSYENIIYLLKTNQNARKNSINVSNLNLNYNQSNNYTKISDCSNALFNYLNKTFDLNLEHKENFSEYDEELVHLNNFENDKNEKFYDLHEEIGNKIIKDILPNTQKKKNNEKLNNILSKNLFVRRDKRKQFTSAIVKKTSTSSFIKENNINNIINVDLPSHFLEVPKLECFNFINEKKIYYNIYLIHNDLFVFRLRNLNDKNGYFDFLISLMNIIPIIDDDDDSNNKILKLYSNSLRIFNKNTINNQILPFQIFYYENIIQGEEFFNNIIKLFNYGIKFSQFYNIGESLFQGLNGKYYKCVNKKNSNCYIVKIIKRKKVNRNILNYIRNEIDMFFFLGKINDDNLIKVYEYYEENLYIYLIYELPNEGQFLNHLNKITTNKILIIQKYLINIIKSLSILHSFGFIYDDIILNNLYVFKYENIYIPKLVLFENVKLLFNKEVLKVDNFYNSKNRINNPKFPIEISLAQYYNELADSWQLGFLIYILLFNNMPFYFDKKNNNVNYNLVIPEKVSFNISKEESQIFKKLNNLIISCLDNKFENRPTMNEMISYLQNNEI